MKSIPIKGSLERVFLDKAIELDPKGVTYLDLVGTGITEANIEEVVNNLRNGMFLSEDESSIKMDS